MRENFAAKKGEVIGYISVNEHSLPAKKTKTKNKAMARVAKYTNKNPIAARHQALVFDDLAGEGDQDRREGHPAREVRDVSVGRGGDQAGHFPGDSGENRPPASIAAGHVAAPREKDQAEQEDQGRGVSR